MDVNKVNSSSLTPAFSDTKKQKLLLIVVCFIFFFPFLTKPVHMDDPVFIWVAQNIQNNPWDFFGFKINWYGLEAPVAEINKNPPLTSYYMALIALLFGWSEFALHTAFLLPILLLVLGTYRLASLYNTNSLGASFALICSPAFFVSATTLMVDIFMVSLWIWSIVFWIEGISNSNRKYLIVSSILIALAALTKYIAVSLLPLLLAYTLLVERKFSKNSAILLIPVILITLFFLFLYVQYGQSIAMNILGFSVGSKTDISGSLTDSVTVGVIFMGGCILFPVFYFYFLFNNKQLLWMLALLFLTVTTILFAGKVGLTDLHTTEGARYGLLIQWVLFFITGIICIALLYFELKNNRNPLNWLLCLWICGILFFAFFLNWSTNGRSLLTIAPAIAILLWRRLETNDLFINQKVFFRYLPLLPALLISIAIAWSDYRLAKSGQDAAIYSVKKYASTGSTLWFQGSWGFHYYMQNYGAKRIVVNESILNKGDILIIPGNNTNTFTVPKDKFELIEIKKFETSFFASVMSPHAGAGFYTSNFGSLPYVLGKSYPESYYILKVLTPWKATIPASN